MAGGSVFFVNQLLCFVNVRYLTHKIRKHMRSKNTLVYLGLWEQLNNPNFKGAEFDPLLKEAGSNAFTMSPTLWVELTYAVVLLNFINYE